MKSVSFKNLFLFLFSGLITHEDHERNWNTTYK